MGNQMKKLLLLPMALLLVLICGQAYPPASSGGAQADPLTLGGGIVSADGGVMNGRLDLKGTYPGDGGSALRVEGGAVFLTDGGYIPIAVSGTPANSIGILMPAPAGGKLGIAWGTPASYASFNYNSSLASFETNVGMFLFGTLNTNKTDVPGVIVGATSGDGLVNAAGAYPRIMKVAAGAPAGADCDAAGEAGRQYYDSTANQMFVCVGAGGWKSVLYPL